MPAHSMNDTTLTDAQQRSARASITDARMTMSTSSLDTGCWRLSNQVGPLGIQHIRVETGCYEFTQRTSGRQHPFRRRRHPFRRRRHLFRTKVSSNPDEGVWWVAPGDERKGAESAASLARSIRLNARVLQYSEEVVFAASLTVSVNLADLGQIKPGHEYNQRRQRFVIQPTDKFDLARMGHQRDSSEQWRYFHPGYGIILKLPNHGLVAHI